MTTSTQWQLARESAERYQNILMPAILGPFAWALVDFAALQKGESVVDVGCGTGAATRYAAEVVGAKGRVTGVDVNIGMIEVARSLPAVQGAPVAWHVGNATQLPLHDSSVEVVLCAQTLQFLPEKQLALTEMWRVIKPHGRIAISLWCDIADNPYFNALVDAVARHIGPETAVGLHSAFALTNADEICALLKGARLEQIEMSIQQLDLPLPLLTEFVPRHISATPMAAGFNHASKSAQERVIQEVVEGLKEYGENGRIAIPFQSHMIISRK